MMGGCILCLNRIMQIVNLKIKVLGHGFSCPFLMQTEKFNTGKDELRRMN